MKDQRSVRWWFRLTVGRMLMWRERRILKALEGVPGVPRLHAVIDSDAFALEYIPGKTANGVRAEEVGPQLLDRIAAVIRGLHEAGYAHGDLKRAANFLFREDGAVYLLDFASAIPRGSKWNLPGRWLFSQIRQTDWRGLAKLKQRLVPEMMTEEDRRLLAAPVFLEKLARLLMGR